MRSVHLVTEVPGPRSRELAAQRAAVVPRGVSDSPVYVASAHGATVTDVDGNVFLDFAGGIGTLNAGATPEHVVAAVREQAAAFLHTCFQVVPYSGYIELVRRLTELVPISGPTKGLLLNSGAEALENAVKIARHHSGRPGVVVFDHAFHGRTLLTMALTAKQAPYKKGFGPFPESIHRLPAPYPYRGISAEDAWTTFQDRLRYEIGPETVAAVIMEPVLGEGGFLPLDPEFLTSVRAFCREHGIVFVADEVQTGFGRTGSLFASEQYDSDPDLICMAKSLAAGLPLSAVVGRAEIMDSVQPGGLGGTYAGNPLACAAALATLDTMLDQDLAGRARALGGRVMDTFHRWWEQYPLVGDARGLGAMCAVELVSDRETRAPAGAETQAVLDEALRRGVMLVKAGTYGNVLRFLGPLVMSEDELDEGLDIVESCIAQQSPA